MGDNRYNSVDCRFDADQDTRPLAFVESDPGSTVRFSMLGLRLIGGEYVLGRSVFRLFPFSRIGPISERRTNRGRVPRRPRATISRRRI
jgi:hypothetical protein